MASGGAYQAIKAAVASATGGAYTVLDWEEARPSAINGETPWLAVEDGGGSEALRSIGSPAEARFEERGLITVHVYVPTFASIGDARAIVDMLRDALRYTSLTSGSDRITIETCGPAQPSDLHEGVWSEVEFDIVYVNRFTRPVAA
jgi:hypothetical protein